MEQDDNRLLFPEAGSQVRGKGQKRETLRKVGLSKTGKPKQDKQPVESDQKRQRKRLLIDW